jgi:hypothetical protein
MSRCIRIHPVLLTSKFLLLLKWLIQHVFYLVLILLNRDQKRNKRVNKINNSRHLKSTPFQKHCCNLWDLTSLSIKDTTVLPTFNTCVVYMTMKGPCILPCKRLSCKIFVRKFRQFVLRDMQVSMEHTRCRKDVSIRNLGDRNFSHVRLESVIC